MESKIINFSIGQAVAAIAIIIALFSMAKPIFYFRYKVKKLKLKVAIACLIVSIGFVFVAAFLPSIHKDQTIYNFYNVDYSLFWELFAGLFFCLGSLSVLELHLKPVRFNNQNYKKYFNAFRWLLAEGSDADLKQLAVEINYSAENIINAAAEYDRLKAHIAKDEGEKYEVSEYVQYAFALLDICSDERFCKIIVDSAPITAIEFIEHMTDSLGSRGGRNFVEQLTRQAFLSESSLLHREEEYYGLGHYPSFTHTFFGNYRFVNSDYNPLNAITFYKKRFQKVEIIKKYSIALQASVTSYFKNNAYGHTHNNVINAVKEFGKHSCFFISDIREENTKTIYRTMNYDILRDISLFFMDIIKLTKKYQEQIPDYRFDEATYKDYNDYSIYGAIANGAYKYFKSISMDRNHDDEIRFLAIHLWQEIFSAFDNGSKHLEEIQKRFLHQIRKKMYENLQPQFYPMITRLLINLVGLHEIKKDDSEKIVTVELQKAIKENFKSAYEKDSEKAMDILPDRYSYDEKDNVIKWTTMYEKKQYSFKLD